MNLGNSSLALSYAPASLHHYYFLGSDAARLNRASWAVITMLGSNHHYSPGSVLTHGSGGKPWPGANSAAFDSAELPVNTQ
jgi:hypothetical protein